MRLPQRYTAANLRRAVTDPSLLKNEVLRLGRSAAIQTCRAYYRRTHSPGRPVVDFDWDNLFILDGCRYDTFCHVSSFNNAEMRTSAASESWEFLSRNFAGRELYDIVYITANPHWYKLSENTFHAVIDLLDCAWDSEVGTVRPKAAATEARRAAERFPNKRLVIHFMQPHFPFLGDAASGLPQKGLTIHRAEDDTEDTPPNIWSAARRGEVELTAITKAYLENLSLVLDVAQELHTDLGGQTVLTADHGNLLGDRLRPIPIREYGHPHGLYAPGLVHVPWQTLYGDRRREIRADPPMESQADLSDSTVSDRLQALGYV